MLLPTNLVYADAGQYKPLPSNYANYNYYALCDLYGDGTVVRLVVDDDPLEFEKGEYLLDSVENSSNDRVYRWENGAWNDIGGYSSVGGSAPTFTVLESNTDIPYTDGSGYLYTSSSTYQYNVGDTVLFDNPGDEITIKASIDHAVEMNIRQYVDGNVMTSWLTQIADQTYIVPNGYLEFEFLSTSDDAPIEIETSTSPIQVENPTVTTKMMVNGESSYNKLTIENQRSDNVQVNIHAEDSGLLEKPFTHIIYYEKVSQLDQTFWNPTGQTYLGNTTGSMTVYIKPNEKIVIWNVHRTTRVEYLDKFNIVVKEESEEYDANANNGLPYYDSGDFTYNPDYDSSGTIEPPPVTESTLFDSVYWIYNTIVSLITMLADGIEMLWNGVGQMKYVMDDLFSFLPAEMRNVLYIGALVGVIKGIFGR